MQPIAFPQVNLKIAEDQDEYRTVPAYKAPENPQGTTIFCWRLTLKERLRVLLTGKVWHTCLTFNQPLQPQLLTAESPFKHPN